MFKLIAHSGFASADYSVTMSSGGSSDGGYITSARLDSRTIDIKFDFGGRLAESIRQELIRFFAPNRELSVTARRGSIRRTITGRAINFDISETNRHAHSIVSLSILCPDPYFKSTETISKNASIVTPMFFLPFGFPPEGIVLGEESSTGSLIFTNQGDTSADMTAEFTVRSLTSAPYIMNQTNGKKIMISDTIDKGDLLTISTVRRHKNAFINGVRCRIDPESRFSDFLDVGENRLVYSSDNGSGDMSINIRCTALYLGV